MHHIPFCFFACSADRVVLSLAVTSATSAKRACVPSHKRCAHQWGPSLVVLFVTVSLLYACVYAARRN